MNAYERFLKFIEPWKVEDAACGVVTACNDRYWLGLRLLLSTLDGRCPVVVVDAGLTRYQRMTLAHYGVTVIPCGLTPHMPVTHNTSWLKPWWISLAPFRYTLWIDCDAIVVADLNPIFEHIKEKPLLIEHAYADKAPVPYLGHIVKRYPVPRTHQRRDAVNAGVLGFEPERAADRTILDAWWGMVSTAMEDETVRRGFKFWDEGALHWTIDKLGIQDLIVRDRPGWDKFTHMRHQHGWDEFFEELPIHDDDTILHLIGHKPWLDWVTWMPRASGVPPGTPDAEKEKTTKGIKPAVPGALPGADTAACESASA